MHQNIEIKARVTDQSPIRNFLLSNSAVFKGIDHQRDTYFNVANGRLKLRQGNIENALIHYNRQDIMGPKSSLVSLYPVNNGPLLESLLADTIGIKAIVEKDREIYFIGNVKFHLDQVKGLGQFVEIEAIDINGSIGKEKLLSQCEYYLNSFAITREDLIKESYSDMILDE
jgi:predicted adenylyl cyclase CyaB